MSTIVVVEDQPDSLKLLATLLTLRGHTVIPLLSGERLLETMRDHPPSPDLVLLDIQLPGRDGFALLADLRALPEPRRWKVVALTAHAMPADRERAMAAGFDGYITKPIDVRTFPREVAAYLDPDAGESAGTAGSPESGSR
jgi:CheY-like chemotaxis protein